MIHLEITLQEDQNRMACTFPPCSIQVSYLALHSFWCVNKSSVPQVSWRRNTASISEV